MACSSHGRLGAVTMFLYRQRLPRAVFGSFLAEAWARGWVPLVKCAGGRRTLVRWFRYAQFSLPQHLPETIRVWRGAAGVGVNVAKRGFSWSLDRDVACWFAYWFESKGRPAVIMAEVPRSDILMYSNDHGESEVVLARVPTSVVVAGGIEDWWAACESRQIQNEERMAA